MKFPLTCVALVISCSSAFAQHSLFHRDSTAGFYVRASAPVYKIKSPSFSRSVNTIIDAKVVQIEDGNYDKYGPGTPYRQFEDYNIYGGDKKFQTVNMSAGYRVNRFISAELMLSYHSLKQQYSFIFGTQIWAPLDTANGYMILQDAFMNVRSFREVAVTPSITLQPGFKKVNPYVRIGVELPVYTKVTAEYYGYNTASNYVIDAQGNVDMKLGFRPGFSGAAGVNVQVLPHLQVFAEYALRDVTLYSRSATMTNYKSQYYIADSPGNPVKMVTRNLEELPTAERKINYVKHLDSGSNVYTGTRNGISQFVDENRPQDQERHQFKTSNMRINAGLQYNF